MNTTNRSNLNNKSFFLVMSLALVLSFLAIRDSFAYSSDLNQNYSINKIQSQLSQEENARQFDSPLLNGLSSDQAFRKNFLDRIDGDPNFRGLLLRTFVNAGAIDSNFADQFDSDVNFRENLLNQFDQDDNFRNQVLETINDWMNSNNENPQTSPTKIESPSLI